ncbi:carnitine dehydratase [Cellulomonas hominis]|uniref:Carnitine dehydratase n=1 Tax=Cellulomonas hominis TaxID=156981 RepID=A0A511FF05_9CELL|nr:CoA transferase [Cellulomonas hominis]MBB5471649.1 L-carnitine CoA-transferase [Cellulomonas hominis]NKY09876.1 carnitine dehydratase [Cellulomonas hominis]GEL46408.1 carnitine dehydratase [Cellulomonas hominis]
MKDADGQPFGNLQDLKVVNASSVVAGPFMCGLFAEQGADVIQVENTRVPDMYRLWPQSWSTERRNQRSMSLDIPSEQGRQVLFRLIADADMLVESSKGGTWASWGLTDEVLWEVNPRLVVVHISGFGLTGDPAYLRRASFDSIGQAFSGYLAINGFPDPLPPYVTKPYTGDFVTGLFGAWSALAAVLRSRQTGQGESIDLAQFESLVRLQASYLTDGLNKGLQAPRMGNLDSYGACNGTERCADGWVFVAVGGATAIRNMVTLFGLDGDPDFDGVIQSISRDKPERARKFVEKLEAFCAERTVAEVDAELGALGVAVSPVMTYQMMREHPHYQQRGVFETWEDLATGEDVTGAAPVPRFRNNPSKTVRGGAPRDFDTDTVLAEHGFTADEITALRADGVVGGPAA